MPKLQKMHLVIYLSSALLHGVWFAFSATFGAHDFQMYDSAHYLALSENLSTHNVFSRALQAPFYPDLARTPGYPVFLLVLQSIGVPLIAVACIQSLLAAIVPVLMFDVLRARLHSARVVSIAVSLLFIDLSVLLFAPYILTDGLFYVVFALLMWSLLRELKPDKVNFAKTIFLPALLTGCLVMIRPIALFLPLLLIVWWFYQHQKLRTIVLGAVLVFALPGGWAIRNYATFGTFSMSSMGPNNLLMFNAAGVQAYAEQRDFEVVQREWMVAARSNFDWENDHHATRDYMRWCRHEALTIFRAHPQATVRIFTENALSFFLKPPRGYFDLNFNLKSTYAPLGALGDQRNLSARFIALRLETSTIGLILTVTQFLVNVIQLLLATIGFIHLWKVNRPVFYLLVIGVAYFWFFSLFTQTDARFRLPVVPLLVLASGFGFEKLANFRRLKTKAS
jgi:hypothetical protein